MAPVFDSGVFDSGVFDTTGVGGIAPPSGALALIGQPPTRNVSGQYSPAVGTLTLAGVAGRLAVTLTPPAGSLVFTGYAQTSGAQPAKGALLLVGYAPTLEVSGENMLGLEWAILHPADILLGFQWVVLPQVVTGATLELTWTVIAEAPPLGFTWEVMPEEIFELFESAGVGAAAGIGEDILLPVGRVSRA